MTIEARIGRDLHGELLGRDGGIECDYLAPHQDIIDHTKPICYEAIRVIASPTLDGRLTVPSGWHLDAARCVDHEVTRLPYRTVGFDEALLMLEVVPVEEVAYSVDGKSIEVLDHSPPRDGVQPVEAPPKVASEAVKKEDYGFDRLTRQVCFLPLYRYLGYTDHVEELSEAMGRNG